MLKLFNSLKNSSSVIKPSDEPLINLDIGSRLDYDGKNWEVKEVHEYDWGDGILSYTYLIENAAETLFLDVETDNGLSIELFDLPVDLSHLDENIKNVYRDTKTLPDTLNCHNELFERKLICKGTVYSRPSLIKRKKPVKSYHYESHSGILLAVQLFSNKVFELSLGKKLKITDIKLIDGTH